ncbi:hypothetical protein EOA29_32955, partial [Mesorhizobium sp. M1E.F.Ca.ET.063.01.1.1]
KGGDRMSRRFSPISSVARKAPPFELPISPLAGEMSGRTEGGVTERRPRSPRLSPQSTRAIFSGNLSSCPRHGAAACGRGRIP